MQHFVFFSPLSYIKGVWVKKVGRELFFSLVHEIFFSLGHEIFWTSFLGHEIFWTTFLGHKKLLRASPTIL